MILWMPTRSRATYDTCSWGAATDLISLSNGKRLLGL